MTYTDFLDSMARSRGAQHSTALQSGPLSGLMMSTALDAPPPPPLPRISFRSADVLQTSAGGVVWTAAEARAARRAREPLTLPPWRTALPHGRAAAAATPPPGAVYGANGAAADEAAAQEQLLVSAALRMRVAGVASSMLRTGDSVGNTWDEELAQLQGAGPSQLPSACLESLFVAPMQVGLPLPRCAVLRAAAFSVVCRTSRIALPELPQLQPGCATHGACMLYTPSNSRHQRA